MKRLLTLLGVLAALAPPTAHAVGTAAGTTITNTATANFTVGGTPASASDSDVITVDELLDVTVVSQDGSNVAVNTPDTDRVLTYLVTNVGNGSESYRLSASNPAGDQFDTNALEIWYDSDDSGDFDDGLDTLVAGPGTGTATVNGNVVFDANNATTNSMLVFVRGDIPSSLTDGDLSDIQLQARSQTGIDNGLTNAGDASGGNGDGGTTAVLGTGEPTSANVDQGTFVVTQVVVTLTKTSVVDSQPVTGVAGTDAIPGAIITYTIAVSVTGTGTATGMVVSDPIPGDTTYVASSMTAQVNGAPVTPEALGDGAADDGGNATGIEGEFDGVNVTFDLGNVDASLGNTYSLVFQVEID